MTFTEEQINHLAPDPASAAAGKKLANPAKWLSHHRHETALWGDCQGSGSTPYTTIIDLQQLGFKCSCPSRKFPCKHGLGLLYLYAQRPDIFPLQSDIAAHVADWLNKRQARQTTRTEAETKPVNEEARQKRTDQRFQKIDAGVEELSGWLKDQVRTGLLHVPARAYTFTQKIAARMVDAQAPGLAARLRTMGNLQFSGDAWQAALLREMSITYMLLTAYKQMSCLPTAWQLEIKSLVGIPIAKEEVMQQGEAVRDLWAVLYSDMDTQDNLRMEKVWLYGKESRRFALLLHFYAPGQMPSHPLAVGTVVDAEVIYYPSLQPLRALVNRQYGLHPSFIPQGLPHLSAALDYISQSLSVQPFQMALPLWLEDVVLRKDAQRWCLVDKEGRGVPLEGSDRQHLQILAITLGRPFGCMLLWEAGLFTIKTGV